MIDDKDIATIVRRINTQQRLPSPRNLGAGYTVACDLKTGVASPAPSSWLVKLGVGRGKRFYHVSTVDSPCRIPDVGVRWSEGTSDLEMDFKCVMQFRVPDQTQAVSLVESIDGPEPLGQKLHQIVVDAVNCVMTDVHQQCRQNGTDILQLFGGVADGLPSGESSEINRRVTAAIREKLGISEFQIGVKLLDQAPSPVIFKVETPVTPEGSSIQRIVSTKLSLVSRDYGLFRQSGLFSKQDVIDQMNRVVTDVVLLEFAGQNLFNIVKTFDVKESGEASIEHRIRERVKEQAHAIGYGVEVHQTFPHVALLELKRGMRIEFDENNASFLIEYSKSKVALSVLFEARIAEMEKLEKLLDADEDAENLKEIIKQVAIQACEDRLRGVDSQTFNKAFEAEVRPELENELKSRFTEYGIDASIGSISPKQSETAEWFNAIQKKSKPFVVTVCPVDGGEKFDLKANFEVVAMASDGWNDFDKKIAGYATDERGRSIDLHTAANNVLEEMKSRISEAMTSTLSKQPGFSQLVQTAKYNNLVDQALREIANSATEPEWGLSVAVRGPVAGPTGSEQLLREEHEVAINIRREELRAMERQAGERVQISFQRQAELEKSISQLQGSAIESPSVLQRLEGELEKTKAQNALVTVQQHKENQGVERSAADLEQLIKDLKK